MSFMKVLGALFIKQSLALHFVSLPSSSSKIFPNQSDTLTEAHHSNSRATAISAFDYLRKVSADLSSEVSLDQVSDAMSSLTHYFGDSAGKIKNFIVVSQQRSGSGFVVSLLNSHPEIICFAEFFLAKRKGYIGQSLHEAFEEIEEEFHKKVAGGSVAWAGFKLMISQQKKIGSLKTPKARKMKLLYLWRRNVLRQIISGAANNAPQTKGAHPDSKEAAKHEQKIRVKLPTTELVPKIEELLRERCDTQKHFRKFAIPECPATHYEEWADATSNVVETVEKCLGVKVMPLTSDFESIHEQDPVLQSVYNSETVKQAVGGEKWGYLLEDGHKVQDELKRSDVIEEKC